MKGLLLTSCFIGCTWIAGAQSPLNQEKHFFTAAPSKTPIVIDGELNEDVWKTADIARDFWQNFPYDTSYSVSQTIVRMSYDADFIYIAAECYDDLLEKEYVITSLRRDFTNTSDLFEVFIDPFGDKTNGFAFGVSPFGVEREGMVSYGQNVDYTWDNKWYSGVKRASGKWTVEMAIPLKTLRFKNNSDEWRINFTRVELKRNERSAWVPVGRVYPLSSLAFSGLVHFETPVKKNGYNVSLIPYATTGTNRDYDTHEGEKKLNGGVDAKVAVSSSLNLDLTVNPDFSQVEVDRQVTNLSRFEIFFPERRQFFVENSDIFSQFGFSAIRPFFSRRIGSGKDPYTGQFKQEPIIFGARLSGRIDEKWRIGVMNMQTGEDKSINLESTNYGVFAIQRQVFARSNIAAIFVNKQVFSDSSGETKFGSNKYNRIIGFDYNLASRDNKWSGKFFYHQAFTPENKRDAYSHASNIIYTSQTMNFEWNHEYVGENYQADVGYIQRNHYWRLEPDMNYWFYPKNRIVNSHGPYAGGDVYFDSRNGRLLDADMDYGWIVNFQNSAALRVFYRYDYTYLFSAFDPTNTSGPQLPVGSDYLYNSLRIRFQSNLRKVFNYNFYLRSGQYFSGNINSLAGNFSYRMQPHGTLGVDYTLTSIRMPDPYHSADLVLIGPSLDWAFTRTIFLKAVIQYNNQINNVNSNIRFQWRFKPVSDLYIVYTDNYTDQFAVKNRGVVVKLTYWFNL